MSSGGLFGAAVEAKRLVENLLSDLRTLSTDARKKHSQVKEVVPYLIHVIILHSSHFKLSIILSFLDIVYYSKISVEG